MMTLHRLPPQPDDSVPVGAVAFSVSQASRYLGVCDRTGYRMVQRGELPFFRAGALIRILRDDLDAWIRAQRGTAWHRGRRGGDRRRRSA